WAAKSNFEYHLRFGVRHFTSSQGGTDGGSRAAPSASEWKLEDMKRWKAQCDQAGMVWEAIRMDSGYIYFPAGAERDRRLAIVADNIRKAGAVGVKVVTMHWTMIPIRRNRRTPGRGGSSYNGFKLEENWRELPVGPRGVVSYDDYWERIAYFLK